VAIDLGALLEAQGLLLESAQGPIPNVAQLVAGERIAGSWWGHPAHQEIFEAINELADSADVARMRLVNGKVTLVHRRLWPAARSTPPPVPIARHARRWSTGSRPTLSTPRPD
jgi:hypothetical protein